MKYTVFGTKKNLQQFIDKQDDYIRLLGEINLNIVEVSKPIKNKNHIVNRNHGVIVDSTDGYMGPIGHNGPTSPIGSYVGSFDPAGSAGIKPKNNKLSNYLDHRTLHIFNNYEELVANQDLIMSDSICLCLSELKCYFRVNILTKNKSNSSKGLAKDTVITFIEIRDNNLQYYLPVDKVVKKVTDHVRLDLFLDSYNPEKKFKFINYKFLLSMKTQDLKSFKDKINDYEKTYATIKDTYMSFTNPLEAESATEIYINILNQIVTEIVDLYSLVTEVGLVKISTQEDVNKLDTESETNLSTEQGESIIYDSIFGNIKFKTPSFLTGKK